MSRFLYRLGGSAAAHPWRTISAWILIAATAMALASIFGGTPKDVYDVPDARAQVHFGRHGSKWLALSIAKLTPVD